MTLGEALIEGVQTTVLGMATIFAVLAILMAAISIMKNIFYKSKETASSDSAAANTETEAVMPEAAQPVEYDEQENEEELIAVFAAAIAASLNTSTYNLKIKSYRRTDKRNPAWNAAGIRDNINSRF